ncbi:MAG: hypothetical protein LBU23_04205 [Planctomycetota bacterium]|jgi:hypothetical protein|nr:hypothetical protein [Planctomycetota bacterium]
MHLFPFEMVEKNSNIVIYGAGRVGRDYVNQAIKSGHCRVVCALDLAHGGKGDFPVPVRHPDMIREIDDYSTVVIALRSRPALEEAKAYLSSLGVPWHKIAVPEIRYVKSVYLGRGCILLKRLRPYDVNGAPFRRLGGPNDGGYVMLDDLSDRDIAYSFGVSSDSSWETAVSEKGIRVFMYDHTIDQIPAENPLHKWEKIGISAVDAPNAPLKTLKSLLAGNGHGDNLGLILKMDVENDEWAVFAGMDDAILRQFRQIVVELHALKFHCDYAFQPTIAVLDKLLGHHLPVHVHANNYGSYGIVDGMPLPDTLEVTYARKADYEFAANARVFPTPLDMPNNPSEYDYALPFFSRETL